MRSACLSPALYCSLLLAVVTHSCRASTCQSTNMVALKVDTLEKDYLPLGAFRVDQAVSPVAPVHTYLVCNSSAARERPVSCSTFRFAATHQQLRGVCAATGFRSRGLRPSGDRS